MYKHESLEDESEHDNNVIIDVVSDDEDVDMEDEHADSENDNVENKEDVEDAEKDNDEDNITANESFINPSQLEAESVEFDVFVKCKDHWLKNDQIMYMSRLRSVPEIET